MHNMHYKCSDVIVYTRVMAISSSEYQFTDTHNASFM